MSSIKKEIKTKQKHQKFNWERLLLWIGGVMLFCGVFLFILTFFPVIKQEALYRIEANTTSQSKKIVPVNTEFGIVIPKIRANTKVVANVDPLNEKVYQQALTQGVAHARGTVLPGQTGNTFIFAHSAGNWYVANQYNAVFYLLYKLVKGDAIDVFYQNKQYTYKVREVKYIDANEVNYLSPRTDGWKMLTLMTCWPPGTTMKRLIVIADIQE